MAKDFQDIQQLDSEGNDHQPGGGEGLGHHGLGLRREAPFRAGEDQSPGLCSLSTWLLRALSPPGPFLPSVPSGQGPGFSWCEMPAP